MTQVTLRNVLFWVAYLCATLAAFRLAPTAGGVFLSLFVVMCAVSLAVPSENLLFGASFCVFTTLSFAPDYISLYLLCSLVFLFVLTMIRTSSFRTLESRLRNRDWILLVGCAIALHVVKELYEPLSLALLLLAVVAVMPHAFPSVRQADLPIPGRLIFGIVAYGIVLFSYAVLLLGRYPNWAQEISIAAAYLPWYIIIPASAVSTLRHKESPRYAKSVAALLLCVSSVSTVVALKSIHKWPIYFAYVRWLSE